MKNFNLMMEDADGNTQLVAMTDAEISLERETNVLDCHGNKIFFMRTGSRAMRCATPICTAAQLTQRRRPSRSVADGGEWADVFGELPRQRRRL